jgi:ABC-2 type transport system ATP-binding protein
MLHAVKPILAVEKASVAYTDRLALHELSLELYAGELLGLLGPNGAGKTTLVRCLSGGRKLTSGTIDYREINSGFRQRMGMGTGLRAARHKRLAEHVGVVPQEIALYGDLTVDQNLQAFATFHGLRGHRKRERIDEALAWAALDSRRNSLVSTLSGGMQRRLNLACSTLHRPRVLLLDEPTVGIDPQSRERIYEMLEVLLERGTAILLTTHQLEEAQQRCDRIAIMDAGRVIAAGTFDELVGKVYQHPRQLAIRFDRPVAAVPKPLVLNEDRTEATGILGDERELPMLLSQLLRTEAVFSQVTFREPPLQQLFLALTGKELRE